jgi:hypothetical protein
VVWEFQEKGEILMPKRKHSEIVRKGGDFLDTR